jgi:hypothetical protein
MIKKINGTILIILMGLIVAYSTTSYRHDYDRDTNFEKYNSFTLYEARIKRDPLSGNPFLKKSILNAIAMELESKGYLQSEQENIDYVVVVNGGAKEKIQFTDWGGYWYNPWWGSYGRSVEVSQYKEGTLIIDIVDASRKELVWRGIATSILNGKTGIEKEQKRIEEIVKKSLASFPPGVKK